MSRYKPHKINFFPTWEFEGLKLELFFCAENVCLELPNKMMPDQRGDQQAEVFLESSTKRRRAFNYFSSGL